MKKIIHYCWFGKNELPDIAQKCIASWRKYCPDYEILEWNESNFDLNCCDYVREAYKAQKWAFVSDYARFKILYENGGLYFDTDVELIRPINDIIEKGGFMGLERDFSGKLKLGLAVNPGLGLAAEPKLELYKELLDAYHNRHFIKEDGSYNLKTIVDYTTEIMTKNGLKQRAGIQYVAGVYIYPKEYFCPIDYATGEISITENTYSIHHYSATWHGEEEAYAHKLQRKLVRVLPYRFASIMSSVVAKIKYEGFFALLKYVFKKIKHRT